jgi:hypothetical protein
MNPGDVLLWPAFSYDDGTSSNKLLVVLAIRPTDSARFIFKTTSQARHYFKYDNDGCHADASVHRFKQYLAGFRVPTWIQFDPPIFRSVAQANAAGARSLFSMKAADLKAIINCYRKSPDCSEKLVALLPK